MRPSYHHARGRRELRRAAAPLLAGAIAMAACTGTSGAPGDPPTASKAGPAARVAGGCKALPKLVERARRGYVPGRSPQVLVIPHEPNYVGTPEMPVHSGPWDYLAEVPLVMFGPGVIGSEGAVDAPATMADIAPTTARLIGFEGFSTPDGRPLPDAATGAPGPSPRPRLVVVVVWDGGGWNVLREHPRAWPFLRGLMTKGVHYPRMTVGSTPSVTPPIHTTLGTGVYPRSHGIAYVRMKTPEGVYGDPFEGNSPALIRAPTLADVYDRAMGNKPLIGTVATVSWHLGMMGHGALAQDGDADTAVLLNDVGMTYGDPSIYSIPAIDDPEALNAGARRLDGTDGALDGAWMGHSLDDTAIRYATPAYVNYQERILERLIGREGFGDDNVPDLLYTNFKSPDDAGHKWGMTSPEVGAVVSSVDRALAELVGFLDAEVGRGRWVVMVTADHGQTRYPHQSGAWPIRGGEMAGDLNETFDSVENQVPLVERVTSAGISMDTRELAATGASLEDIARAAARYTAEDNLEPGGELPQAWRDREDAPLFDAAMVGRRVVARSC